MNAPLQHTSGNYGIWIEALHGRVEAYHDELLLASSNNAKVMYETRLPPAIYFPAADLHIDLSDDSDLRTFCPFKGTATYGHVNIGKSTIENGWWSYRNALPEAKSVEGHIGFMPHATTNVDLGRAVLRDDHMTHIAGPTVDWLLREAWLCPTPVDLTKAIAEKLIEDGVALSRMSVMIWSLHPTIAGKNYVWSKDTGKVEEFTPSYDIHDNPAFANSPLRHVSNGLGGVRQRLNVGDREFNFPIMDDLKAAGASDYVAMPLPFSDGRTNVLTLTCDHPNGFTTPNLGLVFEMSSVISRYYEVFSVRSNSQSLLETYLGKRTGARVLGGEIRRGDGDVIDAAILFCDLRNSTGLEQRLGRDDYLQLLNEFFEQTTGIVNENGGEVLKFIGDAVLAIFPAGDGKQAACEQAQVAAVTIAEKLAEERSEMLDCAMGVAFGDVTYGNVGSQERLDFTVIGSAANIAARLADFGKANDHRIVVTNDIAMACSDAKGLGTIDLHNISGRIEAHAIGVR